MVHNGFDLNRIDAHPTEFTVKTCLLQEYVYDHDIGALTTLLAFRKHLDFNMRSSRGDTQSPTALEFATESGFIRVVHLLLQAGAKIYGALPMAGSTGRWMFGAPSTPAGSYKASIQKMLLAAGADPTEKPKSTVFSLPVQNIHPRTKDAARKWLKILENAAAELMKIFDDNEMLVQEVKDFTYTEDFLRKAINA